MRRIGSHLNPPPRLLGETTDEYLEVLRTCDWEFTPAELVARSGATARGRTRPTVAEKAKNMAERRFGGALGGIDGPVPLPVRFANRANEVKRLQKIPCPICTKAFTPRISHRGYRKKTCGEACGRILAARTTRKQREAVPA